LPPVIAAVDEVDTLIKRKAVHVYDNNSEDRYKVSHVPTAKWVQFDEVKASDLPQEKDAKLVFYCANEH
jgi:rhodanese-related sulfurtransferase